MIELITPNLSLKYVFHFYELFLLKSAIIVFFRRTNRETPSKPCQYITTIVTRFTEFRNTQAPVCPGGSVVSWLVQMTEQILQVYILNVTDVLENVTKVIIIYFVGRYKDGYE